MNAIDTIDYEVCNPMNAKQRAEYKRRRTVAIKRLRELGLSEAEIQTELAKLRESLGIAAHEPKAHDSVENLPAKIDSADRRGTARSLDRDYPEKPGRDKTNRSIIPENIAQYDSVLSQHSERRCAATNTRGEQCRKYAIAGGRVCKTHGGATRQVKDKARIRLEMTAVPLVRKLTEIAFDDTKPAAVQLDAIQDALNRIGITKPTQVEVGPMKSYEEIFNDIASGSRADYRAGRTIESGDDPMADICANSDSRPQDYSSLEDVLYQYNSPPAPADVIERPTFRSEHGDSDRLRATQSRERSPDEAMRPRGYDVTGEDAIRLANEANLRAGSLRALPPGRGH